MYLFLSTTPHNQQPQKKLAEYKIAQNRKVFYCEQLLKKNCRTFLRKKSTKKVILHIKSDKSTP